MGVVIDTSILVSGERGDFDVPAFVNSLGVESVALASVTASELLHGVERAVNASVRKRRSGYVEGLLANIPVLGFGLEEALTHARLWADLARRGKTAGTHDLLIAATALTRGSSVATLDVEDFRRIPGIVLTPVDRFRLLR